MNKIFEEKLGRNINLYVDNMILKSQKETYHIKDLVDPLSTLRVMA